eukprot:682605-Hanusia_phi.AAC.2
MTLLYYTTVSKTELFRVVSISRCSSRVLSRLTALLGCVSRPLLHDLRLTGSDRTANSVHYYFVASKNNPFRLLWTADVTLRDYPSLLWDNGPLTMDTTPTPGPSTGSFDCTLFKDFSATPLFLLSHPSHP